MRKDWGVVAFVLLLGVLTPGQHTRAQSVTAPASINGNPDSFETISGVGVVNLTGSVRVTVTVDSGNIQIGTETTAPLSAPQGYMAADWTSGNADEISFEGTLANVNTALDTLAYRGFGGTLTTTASTAGSAYFADTGHFYEYVAGELDWTDADTQAAARTLNGQNGYLATITTQGEMVFVVQKIGGDDPVWLGGSDDGSEGDWYWTRGVDGDGTASDNFWEGGQSGSVQNGMFASWCNNEPNNAGGNEPYLQITFETNDDDAPDGGCWNDLRNNGSTNDQYNPTGYVVEYNAPAALVASTTIVDVAPTLQSITRNTPSSAVVPSSAYQNCGTTLIFNVTFSESVSGVSTADFTLSGAGSTGMTIDAVSASSGTSFTVTVSCPGNSNLGAVNLNVSASASIIDSNNSNLVANPSATIEGYTLTDRPALDTIIRVAPAARVIASDDTQSCLQPQFQADFSKDVRNVTADDFTIAGTANSGVTVDTVAQQTASRYLVTLACLPAANRGTLSLALAGSNDIEDLSALSLASNDIGSNQDYEITNEPQLSAILRDNPTAQNIAAQNLGSCIAPRFRINFSEPVQNVDVTDFALLGDGATGLTIESVASLTNAAFTATLSCIPADNRGTISLTLSSSVTIIDSLSVPLDEDAVASSQSYIITEDRITPVEDPSVDEIIEANAEAPVVAVEKQLTHIKERLSEQRAAPSGPEPGPIVPQQAPLTPTRRVEMVATRLNQLATYFQQTENGNVYFDTASSDLSTAARITLARQAQQLKRYDSAVYMIEGHTDKRGSLSYNQKLGTTRAQAVRNYFIEQGISEERVQIVSFGEERPASGCGSEDCFKLNRRAQTRLVINEAIQQEIGAEIDSEYGTPITLDDRTSRSSCGLIASLSLSNDTGTMQDTRPVLCDRTQAMTDELGQNWGVWTQGLISIGIVQNGNDGPEMDFSGQNLTFGIDYRFPTNTIIGFALGSGQNDLKGETASKSETEQIVASFYLAQPIGAHWAVNLSGGHVVAETQSTRIDSETSEKLSGQRDGASDFANAEMVYYLRRDEATLDLSLGYTYMRSRFDAYNETGSAALSFARQEVINRSAAIGAKWNFAPAKKQSAWRFNVKAGAQYDLSDESIAKVNFVNIPSETDYLIVSRNDEPLTLSVGGGAEWSRARGDQLTLDYNYQQNAQLSRIHAFSVTYRKPF